MKTVAKFEIKHYQYLDPKGKPTQKTLPKFASDKETMLEMYKKMVFVRVFDNKSIALQRTGQLGTYASCLGHEATHVTIGAAMKPEDAFFPMYRDYGVQFMRGVHPHEVLLFWGGDERGNNFEVPKHDFPWAVPIATQNHHATGAAFAFQYRGEKRAAVTTIGDGGTSQGDFYESLNAAGAWQLPAVFVVVNNKWAISVPLSAQTCCETLAQKGIGAGIHSEQVDGNDFIAMRDAMDRALERARNGDGPTLIEAMTYRLSDHTTADDASRYRPAEELESYKDKEPMIRAKQYMIDQGWWSEKQEEEWRDECAKTMDAEIKKYKAFGKPPVTDMFDYMFDELTDNLKEQREIALSEMKDAEAGNHG
ncbi:MAG TPA: pyruvate dehydrogenase (acetyl-transferring) E1 component subunit alpha [Gammaproteobacteria bacterium]|nr:pyruvate dehydrogenase (acetyl-transferring) E1 component subunit alpha [Gammaproteobacteria bacterium]